MSTTKQIKALIGFHGVTDADVLNRGIQVETSLTGNSHFPNPPVDLATLKAGLDTFAALIPQTLDGSKKVIAEKNRTIAMEPGFAPAHVYRAMAYEQKGMFDEAIADLEGARDSDGGRPSFSGALGHAYAVAGRKEDARMLLRDLKESSAKHYFPPYHLALIYVGLGEKEEALTLLEKAYEERYPWLIQLSVEPRLDPLRSEPRFKALVSRIGLNQPKEFAPAIAHQ